MGGINALALIPGTPNLVSVGQEKRVSMWDNRESTPLSSVDSPQGAPPMGEQTCVSLMVPAAAQGNPAYAIFATAGQGDCRIRLWRRDARDPSRPQLMLMGDGHSKPVRAVQVRATHAPSTSPRPLASPHPPPSPTIRCPAVCSRHAPSPCPVGAVFAGRQAACQRGRRRRRARVEHLRRGLLPRAIAGARRRPPSVRRDVSEARATPTDTRP